MLEEGRIIRRVRFFVALSAAFLLFIACSSDSTSNFQRLNEQSGSIAETSSDQFLEVEDLARSTVLGLDEVYTDPRYRTLVLEFFSNQTGSEHIAELILRESERQGLPASLTFALAWTESRFDPYAVNYNHSSIDRGVFQLNNRSFPKLHEEQFFDPEINIEHGVAYLKYCLERGENQITALAMYNAGPRRVTERGAPLVTLEYINKILSYREQLQRDFESKLKIASLEAKLGKSVKNPAHVVDRSKLTK